MTEQTLDLLTALMCFCILMLFVAGILWPLLELIYE